MHNSLCRLRCSVNVNFGLEKNQVSLWYPYLYEGNVGKPDSETHPFVFQVKILVYITFENIVNFQIVCYLEYTSYAHGQTVLEYSLQKHKLEKYYFHFSNNDKQ